MRYAVVEKKSGETPLMALETFRAKENLGSVPLTYAGRLDPMASGKLLILIGEECKRRSDYDGLDKEYDVEMLIGVSSDTGDILGLADMCAHPVHVLDSALRRAVTSLNGNISLPYPPYSSKPVEGKPLYQHALSGSINSIEVPVKTSRIYRASMFDLRLQSSQKILAEIESRIATLRVDEADENPHKEFRRPMILKRWREILQAPRDMQIARMRFTVSSGTYMRSLMPHIAESLGACGLAYSIHRTRIGRYMPVFGRGLWYRTF